MSSAPTSRRHARLDEAAWEAAWGAEERAMTPEQAVAYALEDYKALLALPPSIRSRTR